MLIKRLFSVAMIQQVAERFFKVFEVELFWNDFGDLLLYIFNNQRLGEKSRHDDYFAIKMILAEMLNKPQAVYHWHTVIRDHDLKKIR